MKRPRVGGPHEQQGVAFPLVGGARSTTATATAVLADAARSVDRELADRILGEPAWRSAYPRHLRDLVAATAGTAEAAVSVATNGLGSMRRRFVVAGGTGDDVPLADALAQPAPCLGTREVAGTGTRETELAIPYGGRRLCGGDLRRVLDGWRERGIVEPSHADAVAAVMDNPHWLDLSDRVFVVLGAGAEMAPLRPLLRWGATVRAVDLPRAEVTRRLLDAGSAGAGRLLLPVLPGRPDTAESAGADLLRDAPAVLAWLRDEHRPLVIGDYGYAEGAAFPRLTVAVDALSTAALADRPDTVLAVLATPTHAFVVPQEAVAEARRRYATTYGEGAWRAMLRTLARGASGGRLFTPNYRMTVRGPEGREVGVADCLVHQQGPNYAFAKELQRWRAVAVQAAGGQVSANVAPPTRTRSVLRNRALAAAYAGAHRFGVEVFAPETSSTLMAALLVHDLRAEPARLAHPLDLFVHGANHGGLWRVAYEPRSVLGLAVLLGLWRRDRPSGTADSLVAGT